MKISRQTQIENLSGDGNLSELASLLGNNYTQLEIDIALENAIANSQIETAKFLLSLGANFSNYDYQGVYYAVHNNEIEGLKFAIKNGVDIDINEGMIINASILTCINNKDNEIIKWIINNGANLSLLTNKNINLVRRYGNSELIDLTQSNKNVG